MKTVRAVLASIMSISLLAEWSKFTKKMTIDELFNHAEDNPPEHGEHGPNPETDPIVVGTFIHTHWWLFNIRRGSAGLDIFQLSKDDVSKVNRAALDNMPYIVDKMHMMRELSGRYKYIWKIY